VIETNRAVVIRAAGPDDLTGLSRLEEAADVQLQEALGGVLPPPQPSGDGGELFILVAGRPPVGFARVDELDGQAHLEQLSVHPMAGRRGLGRALVEAAANESRLRGFTAMTLCTFADIAFNAPFYASCGFEEFTCPGPGLAALRAYEGELGLDALGRRISMRREI
jgi:GNAT superfamily N-acetyltransferase